MELKMSDKMRAIYEDLRANYIPTPGEYLFFDLSVENYKPQKFSDMWPVSKLMHKARMNKKPNAVVCHDPIENLPILAIDGISFKMEENLAAREVLHFSESRRIDPKQLALEIRQLKFLLNSKAC